MGVFDKAGSFHPAPSDLDFSSLVTLFRERAFKALLECEATTEDRVTLVRSGFTPASISIARAGSTPRIARDFKACSSTWRERPCRWSAWSTAPISWSITAATTTLGSEETTASASDRFPGAPGSPRAFALPSFDSLVRSAVDDDPKALRLDQEKRSISPGVTVVENEGEFLKVRRRNWARLFARTWHEDPSLCAGCGKPMKSSQRSRLRPRTT